MIKWETFWDQNKYGRARPWLVKPNPSHEHLNLGCGNVVFEGFDNIDKHPGPGITVLDITGNMWHLGFENMYNYIFMSNILEHIPPGQPFWNLIDDLVKISKNNAIWEIHGPDPRDVVTTLQNVGHTRLVGPQTFRPLCGDHQGRALSLTRRTDSFRLERLDYTTFRRFKIGKITDWHFRRYLGLNVGKPATIRLVYRVIK